MSNLSVLVVDDDPHSCRIMHMLLVGRMKLQHVTILEDSTDFILRVGALMRRPDIVFLDINVRPLTGFDMLARLREMADYVSVPIVALTASVMNDEVMRVRDAGFHSIIAKPIDLTSFPDTLQRIVHGEQFWRVGG